MRLLQKETEAVKKAQKLNRVLAAEFANSLTRWLEREPKAKIMDLQRALMKLCVRF